MTLIFEGADRELPTMAPRVKLAGVLGAPYPFAMHKRYAREDDGTWRQGFRTLDLPRGHSKREIAIIDNADGAAKKNADDKRPEVLRSHWVNAFAFSQKDGFKAKWLFEAYVDQHGNIYVNPNKTKSNKNNVTKEKGLILKDHSKSQRVNELFGLVNGRHQAYWFVASRHRLTVKALDRFEAVPDLFRKVTLFTFMPKVSMTGLQGTGANVIGYVETEDDLLAIPVDSPLDVGKNLHSDLKGWQEEQIRVNGGTATSNGSVMDVNPSAQNIKDLNRFTISKFVSHYAHDKKVGVDLQLCLAPGGLSDAEKFAKRFEVKRERVARIVETVASDLCHWMDHFIFRIVREEMEKDEDHILIPDYAKCIENLVSTLVGARFLREQTKLLEADTLDPLHKVVFATSPLSEIATKITGAVLADAVIILGTHQALRLADSTVEASHLLEKLNGNVSKLLSADEILEVAEKEFLALVKASDTAENINPARNYEIAKIRAEMISAKPNLQKSASVENALNRIIHLFNIGLAVRSYATVPLAHSLEKQAARDAFIVAGVQTTATIVRKMILDQNLHLASKRWAATAHALGFIATAVTVYHDYKTATGLAKAGDTDAALAMMTSTALSLVSNAVALAASILWRSQAMLRLASNIVALAIAIAAVIAYFFYLYLKDTDIETFFKNCRFGSNAGLGGDAKVPWSTTTLGELNSSWAEQVNVMFALTRGFAVRVSQRIVDDANVSFGKRFDTRLYLDPGELFEDDEFIVTWWWRTHSDQETWIYSDAKYFPISRKRGDNGLVGQSWGRNVRLYPPDTAVELEKDLKLADLCVTIQKKVKGMGNTMMLPFTKYGLQIDIIKYLIYVRWQDGKVVTSAKAQ